MNKQNFDFVVLIGRFQPFHEAHEKTVRTALSISENKVIIFLGSANTPSTFKNPFSAKERQEMITSCFLDEVAENKILFVPIEDRLYQHGEWLKTVQLKVKGIVDNYYTGKSGEAKIGIIGAEKDTSSFYINQFKPWERIETTAFIKEKGGMGVPISATKIRELLLTNHLAYTQSILPISVYEYLEKFQWTLKFEELKKDYEQELATEKTYENFPYAVNFFTVDGVVIQSGHVLMVRRGGRPGKGTWALPGGHVESTETALEAVIRELKEETNLKVPDKVLLGSIKDEHNFDHPDRSLRGRVTKTKCRTFTVGFCFQLDDNLALPHVKADSDAEKAWWFPLSEIENMKDQIFEDHASIINYFIARLSNKY